jgi:hypothetical protein
VDDLMLGSLWFFYFLFALQVVEGATHRRFLVALVYFQVC